MATKVSPSAVRRHIGDLLNRVALRQDEFIIERKGRALAALVPVERLEQLRRFARREALRALEGSRGGDLAEADADALAAAARKWARKDRKKGR